MHTLFFLIQIMNLLSTHTYTWRNSAIFYVLFADSLFVTSQLYHRTFPLSGNIDPHHDFTQRCGYSILYLPGSLLMGNYIAFNFCCDKKHCWASLVVRWLRIRLPMQGTQVRALVREDPTCCGATKPVRHNYWACAVETASHNYWSPRT